LVQACIQQVSKPFQNKLRPSELANKLGNINFPIAYYFDVLEGRWEGKISNLLRTKIM